ncbi:uncharacterized mitochondrial protein AtMg00810-like [Lactuca sativa]|uniref:uncharacterized mitochondrial protein AtMg00810-like n=1 Tax=Lactuca sativa TaxID=4236 RepID=UPI000CD8D7AD|nr:uncharacterized mitochondrial protein AtMg00810-like [Lactuca sativa]
MTGKDDSLQSISTRLDGKNYMYWSYVMKSFLHEKNMWGYVTGTKAKPLIPQTENFYLLLDAWETDNSKSNHDSALFIRCSSVGRILLSLYVDGIIITGDDHGGIESLKHDLAYRFAMKDLGLLRYFLGIEVAQSKKGYLLSQNKYISNLFTRACLSDNRTVDTPLETNARYSPTYGDPLSDPNLSRTVVGSLVYLTVIRPYTAHVVHVVSYFVIAPTSVHWGVVLRILRYLRGT